METNFKENPFNKFGFGNWKYYREKAREKGIGARERLKRGALLILASIPLINIVLSSIELAHRRFKMALLHKCPDGHL